MPRTKTPQTCKAHTDDDGRAWPGCGAVGAWAWRGADKRHAKWFFIDARSGENGARLVLQHVINALQEATNGNPR